MAYDSRSHSRRQQSPSRFRSRTKSISKISKKKIPRRGAGISQSFAGQVTKGVQASTLKKKFTKDTDTSRRPENPDSLWVSTSKMISQNKTFNNNINQQKYTPIKPNPKTSLSQTRQLQQSRNPNLNKDPKPQNPKTPTLKPKTPKGQKTPPPKSTKSNRPQNVTGTTYIEKITNFEEKLIRNAQKDPQFEPYAIIVEKFPLYSHEKTQSANYSYSGNLIGGIKGKNGLGKSGNKMRKYGEMHGRGGVSSGS
jgi:hypothetical protein